jgi:hypothetical protein
MRKRNGFIVFFLLFVAVCVPAQTNRALIVAISDYPPENGWGKTHAVNDCKLIIPMLQANGYKDTNMKVLLNEKATKAQIVQEFQSLASKTRSGDSVYIHFSGHGQQMIDDSGDESDGLDEAFIPYDAHFRYKPGRYEGENHLRDDEMERLIDVIRRRAGENGHVLVVLDACHSGTGARIPEEDEYIRGTSYIFSPPDYSPVVADAELFRLSMNKGMGLSPVTVFGACQPEEVNYEYKTGDPAIFYGRLTYFFCGLIMEHSLSAAGESFFIRLKERMSQSFGRRDRKQTPYFESTHSEPIFITGKRHGQSQ